jgi:hypothetical protein
MYKRNVDEWLADHKTITEIRLKRMTEMKEELEDELQRIDEVMTLRAENRLMREDITRMIAGNDQLQAELNDRIYRKKKKNRK